MLSLFEFMVEVTGLEPAASCSQSKRATNCATPRYEILSDRKGKIHNEDALALLARPSRIVVLGARRCSLQYSLLGGVSLR